VRRLAGIVAVLALAGCGAGAGERPEEVRLTVTDRFGARTVLDKPAPEVGGEETVMRLLQRNARVQARHGGGFVRSIGGLSGGQSGGRPVDWFFYVNGVLAPKGAAATQLHGGDRVWWDRRDWGVTNRVPAVVGSFPEPFVHGFGGERYAARVECGRGVTAECDAVQRQLSDRGVVTGKSLVGTESGAEVIRIVVARWREVRGDRALQQIERGPKVSGVYARMGPGEIAALDARGAVARRFGAGAGLIAATRFAEDAPTWVVTGVDRAGVAAAARAFDERTLRNRFALVVDGGRPLSLPIAAGSSAAGEVRRASSKSGLAGV